MTQGDLYDALPLAPAQRHSEPSLDAARAIEPKAATLRRQVLDFIRHQGEAGATDEEVSDALGMNPSTQRPRRVELWDAGLVRNSGRVRRTRSNRSATVWVAVECET